MIYKSPELIWDLVYFSPNASNEGYGHTGVYSGNGQMISATDNGVKQSNLGDWLKQTGQKILGYVPAAGRAISGAVGGLGNDINNMFGGSGGQSTPPTPQQAIQHNVAMRQAGMQSQVPIPMPPTPDQSQQSQGQPPVGQGNVNISPDPNRIKNNA